MCSPFTEKKSRSKIVWCHSGQTQQFIDTMQYPCQQQCSAATNTVPITCAPIGCGNDTKNGTSCSGGGRTAQILLIAEKFLCTYVSLPKMKHDVSWVTQQSAITFEPQ